MNTVTTKQLREAGINARMAAYVARGERRLSPEKAAEVEQATGISRLHLLYPEEFGPDGQPLTPGGPEANDG